MAGDFCSVLAAPQPLSATLPQMSRFSNYAGHRWPSWGALFGAMALLNACAPSGGVETAASPAVVVTRRAESIYGESGVSYVTDLDDRSVVAKVSATVPAVWQALVASFAAHQVSPTILDRVSGRIGDTAWVVMRRWNGEQMSTYLSCGSNMTGQRANEERVHAVLLAQMSKMKADTIAIALHFSAYTQPVANGSGGSSAQCTSTGRLESMLLDDVIKRARATGGR